jgi:membrane-associated protein
MDIEDIATIINIFLHLDVYLGEVISQYRIGVYILLFLIIFVETGVVIMPFLPGDSLLFAAGSFAALGSLHLSVLLISLIVAAILGDSLNYAIGRRLGRKAFSPNRRFLNHNHLRMTEDFYAKHGNKTLILARFIPIVRTIAPFVAGVGNMNYSKFLFYNIAGALIWVILFTVGGYFFGNIPIVKENFSLVIIAIIIVSLLPIVIGAIKTLMEKRN